MPKRGDRVAPPTLPGEWELRHTKDSVHGWEELCRLAPAETARAFQALTRHPETATNHARQHRLKGELGSRLVQGKNLQQWQYEVTGSGRIWYCPDPDRRIVWLTEAATGHPRQTD